MEKTCTKVCYPHYTVGRFWYYVVSRYLLVPRPTGIFLASQIVVRSALLGDGNALEEDSTVLGPAQSLSSLQRRNDTAMLRRKRETSKPETCNLGKQTRLRLRGGLRWNTLSRNWFTISKMEK